MLWLGGVHGYFLIIITITCFCVFGWRARLLLSTATIASCVFVSGGVHGFFLNN